ncbi:MAG: heavy-metal-associated domain-containing protein [Pseudomonadota bacterium]
MKKFIIAALLAFPLTGMAASSQTAVLDVENMTCSLCQVTVKKALEKLPGVADAKIDLDKKTATVQFDPAQANFDTLIKATTDAGYPSTLHK